MLNIFHVNQGDNLVIEVDNAFGKVKNLKEKIQNLISIPADQHVLLLRDGTMLKNEEDVFSQNAGIESNPIFLYTKMETEVFSIPPSSNYDLTDKIKYAMELSYTYETVEIRTKIVKKMSEYAQEILDYNSEAYNSQLHQHTGWTAITKNLEGLVNAVVANFKSLKEEAINVHLNREINIQLLRRPDKIFERLEKIPLPMFLENPDTSKPAVCGTGNLCEYMFDDYWTEKIKEESEHGISIMEAVNLNVIHDLETNLVSVQKMEKEQEVKSIQGMKDRLKDLGDFEKESHRLRSKIGDFCQIFESNFERAKKTNDVSVFPDLCRSHETHLMAMEHDYTKLRDHRRKLLNSKHELCLNISRRLGWVNQLHTELRKVNNSTVVFSGMLVLLKDILNRIKNVSNAPNLYYKTISEILRRSTYAENNRIWSNKFYEECNAIFTNESTLRDKFSVDFFKNMISSKINGLSEKPSCYACIPGPTEVDVDLPFVSKADVEMVLKTCPEDLKYLFTISSDYGIPPLLIDGLKSDDIKDVSSTSPTAEVSEDFESAAASLEPYDTEPEDFEEIPKAMEETVKYVAESHVYNLSGDNDTSIEVTAKNCKAQQTEDGNGRWSAETFLAYKKQYVAEFQEEMLGMVSSMENTHKERFNKMKAQLEDRNDELVAKFEEEKQQLKKQYHTAIETCRQQNKLEIEGLRSRFRMMTTANMDKSPSETSLEKFDHQEYMESLRKTLEQEFALNLKAQLRSEEEKRNEQIKRAQAEKDEEFSDALKLIHEDKDRVIEDLRLRVGLLTDELEKQRKAQKSIISNKKMASLEDRIVHYKRELSYMTMQLNYFKMRENREEEESEPINFSGEGFGFPSIMLYACFPKISIDSAYNGDIVVFAFDPRYDHYRAVVDERLGLFFLQKSSHSTLGIIEDCPNKHPYVGKIYNKEKCKAKKEENRYRVPKDSLFWRLKACHPKADPPTPVNDELSTSDRKQESIKERKVSRQPIFAEIPEVDSSAPNSLQNVTTEEMPSLQVSNVTEEIIEPSPTLEPTSNQTAEPILDSDDSSTSDIAGHFEKVVPIDFSTDIINISENSEKGDDPQNVSDISDNEKNPD